MIILTLGGGLGNQMFQYAFARKLQKETGDGELKFSGYHLKGTGNSKTMLFNLNICKGITFCNEEEQKRLEKYQERKLRRLHYYRVISRYLKGVAAWKIKQMSRHGFYTTNSVYDRQEYFLSDAPIKYVQGGFQTWRYWRDMEPQIREELKVKTAPSEANRKMMEEMQNCESVCVHIRRGDYLAPEYAHLNICNEAYYMTAIERMHKQKPNAVFYIFTNNHKEIAWIKEHYDFSAYRVCYVDLDNPDYEELRLMYHCRHFIISNSTYSWWGQFLCENPDKIVMAPSVWNRQIKGDGIYMPDWQIIRMD